MRRAIRVLLVLGVILAAVAPAVADPASQRDVVGLLTGEPNRYTPHPVGQPVDLHYVFGPYSVPPGQDSNRITLDVPLADGFMVAVAPDLVDASSGRIPTQQEAHIHHAHWFRVSDDPNNEYYTDLGGGKGLSWVFGTGEEKSQGRLDDRARLAPENNDADPTNDFTYGIQVNGSEPQALIYMIHNKLAAVGNYLVVLDVTFIPGTRDQIKAATGKDIRPLYSQLWGQTKDVRYGSKAIGARWTVTHDGQIVAGGSHVHPGGKAVIVSNLGYHGVCGSSDPDGDGFPGVAILNSYKFDRVMEASPYTENYQMGTTKFGWRAPVHAGDWLTQSATYAVDGGSGDGVLNTVSRDLVDHNWYQAMSYTGIYMDREAAPGTPSGECSVAALRPQLHGPDDFATQGLSTSMVNPDGSRKPGVAEVESMWNHFLPSSADDASTTYDNAIQGMVNHFWQGNPEPLCAQPNLPALNASLVAAHPGLRFSTNCGIEWTGQEGPEVTQIHVAGFSFTPGDLNIGTGTPIIPKVKQGSVVKFINDDASMNVRHTFTSCDWPCKGEYVSNFPLENGGPLAFDSGKIGNVDYIDGGLQVDRVALGAAYKLGLVTDDPGQTDTVPMYDFTVNLPARTQPYTYFCRIHPWMQGAFQVIA